MSTVIQALLHNDLRTFIQLIGYPGVFGVIFAESGLLVGFFLPGDSLIFTAGLLSSPTFGFFHIGVLLIGCWIAAIVGDNVGYEFGKRVGRRLFQQKESFLFKKEHLVTAEKFYEKYGGKAIILARFMPVVRTFAPIVAGIGDMDHKRFTFFNFIGGTAWVLALGLSGYFLGNIIPADKVDKYLLPIIAVIIIVSIVPPLLHLYKENKEVLWKKFKH
ncbi:MAG TPA: VTT domain-containing protein [Candidatus Saccharimonadales bacterium]|nr:VTT domain-containing protein [Candidatus Saccharimonadales bacterium]